MVCANLREDFTPNSAVLSAEAGMMLTRVSSGISGLDEVLDGGFIAGRSYLLSGRPGSGKTTVGCHFAAAGAERGEVVVYVTFAEPKDEVLANAAAVGIDLSEVVIVDVSPSSDLFTEAGGYDLFAPHDVHQQGLATDPIVKAVHEHRPQRIFVDSLTSLRFLATDVFQFRRQATSFLRFLTADGATVVVTSDSTIEAPDDDLRFVVDGVIELELAQRTWSIRVSKSRGSGFRSGAHGMRLTSSGAKVFPRLLPEEHSALADPRRYGSGIDEFDDMLGGGFERGTITLLSGPTGVGKTTLAMACLTEIASRGERTAIYSFDERPETMLRRCENIGLAVADHIAAGLLHVRAIEALRFGPDEFAAIVRDDVEKAGVSALAIDSISGYRMTIEGDELVERLHALGRYLQNIGVTIFLVDELRNLTDFRASDANISYLADNVIFLRYVESQAESGLVLGRSIGILKKRLSDFDKSLRSFAITSNGIQIGKASLASGYQTTS